MSLWLACSYAVSMPHYFMCAHLDPMPGSFLWTSDLPSTHSYQLFCKTLSELKVSNSIYRWITDSLTDREKFFKIKNVSGSWSLSTSGLCLFSSALLPVYKCLYLQSSLLLLDKTSLICLFSGEDESAYTRSITRSPGTMLKSMSSWFS